MFRYNAYAHVKKEIDFSASCSENKQKNVMSLIYTHVVKVQLSYLSLKGIRIHAYIRCRIVQKKASSCSTFTFFPCSFQVFFSCS